MWPPVRIPTFSPPQHIWRGKIKILLRRDLLCQSVLPFSLWPDAKESSGRYPDNSLVHNQYQIRRDTTTTTVKKSSKENKDKRMSLFLFKYTRPPNMAMMIREWEIQPENGKMICQSYPTTVRDDPRMGDPTSSPRMKSIRRNMVLQNINFSCL